MLGGRDVCLWILIGLARKRGAVCLLMSSRGFRSIVLFGFFIASSASGQTPSKEYIYMGGRLLAVEHPSATSIAVSVNPLSVTITASGNQQFSASVSGSSNQSVTWTVDGTGNGSINASGLYSSPSPLSTPKQVTVRALSQADGTTSGTATVTVNPAITVSVNPPSVTITAGSNQQFSASVGGSSNQSVTWTVDETGNGSIGSTGLYTSPSPLSTPKQVTVRALSQADGATSGTTTVTVNPNSPPQLGGVGPASGIGARSTFLYATYDSNGVNDIDAVQGIFTSDWSPANTCQFFFKNAFNYVYLAQDDGSWAVAPLGAAQVLQNSKCKLYPATTTVLRGTELLAVTFDVEFKPAFAGMKINYTAASDFGGNVSSGQVGTWGVPGNAASVVSISAPAQIGPGQNFQSTVVMRNTGVNTWLATPPAPDSPQRLGSTNPNDNLTWGLNRVNLPVAQVPANNDATFVFNGTAPTSLGSKSFSWRMVHESLEWFGATANATVSVTSSPLPESPHPYNNNQDQTWTYTYSGSCTALGLSFDSQSNVLSGDSIHVTNAYSSPIPGSPFTGTALAGQTMYVPGTTARVRLVSNASGTVYGFKINSVTCVPDPGSGYWDDMYNANVIDYSGGWYGDTQFSNPSNGTITYTNSAGSAAEFQFFGTGVSYYYTRAWNRGIAQIYIDNNYVGSVDLYSPNIAWQQSNYFGGLSQGVHTIRVVVSGTKNSASQDYFVDLDGFSIP